MPGRAAPSRPYWTAHRGLDYVCVMAPEETTDSASIRIVGGFVNPDAVARALNAQGVRKRQTAL